MEITQLLNNTYKKELQLKKIDVTQGENINVSFKNGLFNYTSSEGCGSKKLDRPIMHQIGSRIYGNQLPYKEVIENVKREIEHNKLEFEDLVAKKLKETDSIILLDNSKQKIYGMVSSRFEFLNPLDIRNDFVSKFEEYGTPFTEKKSVGITQFGEPFEKFSFIKNNFKHVEGEPIGYSINLIYGLNNGYSSYRFSLNREILICSNGMTKAERIEFAKLKHKQNPNVSGFIDDINKSIVEYDLMLQNRIKEAKETSLGEKKNYELFRRLHVSQAVKDRVAKQYLTEKDKTGNTEWSLSQAFTNIGTHHYRPSFDKYHDKILTEVGSSIVDYSLEELLEAPVKKEKMGSLNTYGILLPKDYGMN
jgi:hypothetical protein